MSYSNVDGVMKFSIRPILLGANLDLIYRNGNFQFMNKLTIDYGNTEIR